MSDKFKQFVEEHRQAFDSSEPDKGVLERIDAQMGPPGSSSNSSRWLSKLKYLGFSASVLVVAYLIVAKRSNAPDTVTVSGTSSEILASGSHSEADHNSVSLLEKQATELPLTTGSRNFVKPSQGNSRVAQPPGEKDSALRKEYSIALVSGEDEEFLSEEGNDVTKVPEGKKQNEVPGNKRKTKIYIPEEPAAENSYSGTLYDASSFRAMLRAYKFPGKVSLDDAGYSTSVKITSCSSLEKMPGIKAVWLKGRTSKELAISIRKKFRNISLVNKEGREMRPVAISHYYKGLGVISEFKGNFFEMLFTDKVELILFFQEVQEGDKIRIDGRIEALVKAQP